MKQKYEILKNAETSKLIIREYAESDKDLLSFLCEETYEDAAIKSAMAKGKETLISALRTQNMYPSGLYISKIAEAVMEIYHSGNHQPRELFFDDVDFIAKGQQDVAGASEVEDEPAELDELLDEHIEEDYQDEPPIDNINSPIKIDDDGFVDMDEDN